MKTNTKTILWNIVFVTVLLSIAITTVITIVMLIRAFFVADDMTVLVVVMLPMLVYTWVVWMSNRNIQFFRDKLNGR